MISLDFSWAIAGYLALSVGVFLFLWLACAKQKGRELFLEQKFIWFCSVCTHTYINTREENISVCPRCASYNKKILTGKKIPVE